MVRYSKNKTTCLSDEMLLPLDTYIENCHTELSNLEWESLDPSLEEQSRIDLLHERIDYANRMIKYGEVYMPMF